MRKLTEQEQLTIDKIHMGIAKECAPIIDTIFANNFPRTPYDELDQIEIHDNMVGHLISAHRAWQGYQEYFGNKDKKN